MKFTSLLLCAALLGLAACKTETKPAGDGPEVTQERNVPSASATGLDVSAPLNLHIRIDDRPSCRLQGPARILSRLKTEMSGNTFRIFTESSVNWSTDEIPEAWVTIPRLQDLHTTGAGEIVVDSRIEEAQVSLHLSGAVDVDFAGIQAQRLDLELSGAGNVLVRSGEADEARLSISGSGNIDAFELKCGAAEISVAGAGRAAITAIDVLKAGISGAGMIRYRGNPEIEKDIAGIGTLQNAN